MAKERGGHGTRGTVFQDGKLYEYGESSVVVRTGGPGHPLAWIKVGRRPWRPHRPRMNLDLLEQSVRESREEARRRAGQPDDRGQLPLPLDIPERRRFIGKEAHLAWLRTLDLDHRAAVLPFAAGHWYLLQLTACCPESLDLLASSPALGLGLALSWGRSFRANRYSGPATRWPRPLLALRQRHLAARMRFPGTASVARILRRVPARELNRVLLCRLRYALADPAVRRSLAHVPSINRAVVYCVFNGRLRGGATQRFLLEIGRDGAEVARLCRRLAELLRLYRQLDPRGRSGPRRLDSVAQLEALYENLSYKVFSSLEGEVLDPAEFPLPPVPGTAAIRPLSTPRLLWEEGESQHNCAASFAAQIARSATRSDGRTPSVYLYRVLEPERATLSIVPRNGCWELDQLVAACNRPVAARTRRAALRWLAAARPVRRDAV